MGTSFAFVHALDLLAGARFALPPGSRAMHTGGFKGRSHLPQAAGDPGGHGPLGNPEDPGDLPVSITVEVVQHHHRARLRAQPPE